MGCSRLGISAKSAEAEEQSHVSHVFSGRQHEQPWGEWYQEQQTGEPIAAEGLVKERDFCTMWDTKMDRLMKGERAAIKCPLFVWQRLRASPGLSEGVGGTCYCCWR